MEGGGGPRWRVFISHTSELRRYPTSGSYVSAVERAVSAAGHVIVDMADFEAMDGPPAELCVREVRSADVYVAVLGTRYGSPVRERSDVSYTELEFDTATAAGIERLVFVLDTDATDLGIPAKLLIDTEHGTRQEAFRRRVLDTGLTAQSFSSPHQLGGLVERSLRALAERRSAPAASLASPAAAKWSTSLPASNVPRFVDPFVGRRADIDRCREYLIGGDRLVTLSGEPGVGKTRLAIEVAASLLDRFDDHVYLVDLTMVTDPDVIIQSISHALRVEAGDPAKDALVEVFRNQQALLILDNFRQVGAATGTVVELVSAAPGLHVLVTSLHPLRDPLERKLSVDRLSPEESLRLFQQRVDGNAAAQWDSTSMSHVCALMEGVPLAIEIVAARAHHFTPDRLLSMLEDQSQLFELESKAGRVPERQRSLRAATAWSYGLLKAPEQELFRRLSVFAGGWTLDAAASVVRGAERADFLLADQMDVLVDNWLVRSSREVGRLTMLDSIRTLAAAELKKDGTNAATSTRSRHAKCFVDVVERAATHLDAGRNVEYLAAIEPELENINAALVWLVEHGDDVGALRIVAAAGEFWWSRDYAGGAEWVDRALSLAPPATEGRLRARSLIIGGRLDIRLNRLDRAAEKFEAALTIAATASDDALLADGLAAAALVFMERGQFDDAVARLERARQIDESLDYRTTHLADVLDSLGVVATGTGDYKTAGEYLDLSRRLYESANDSKGAAWVHNDLARLALALGQWSDAQTHAEHARSVGDEHGDVGIVAWAENYLGFVASRAGRLDAARRHHDESLTIELVLRDTRPIILAIEGFAALAVEEHEWQKSAVLAGAATQLRTSSTLPRTVAEAAILNARLDRATAQLPDQDMQIAEMAGRAMPLERVVALARST